jgi:hypothetical protein
MTWIGLQLFYTKVATPLCEPPHRSWTHELGVSESRTPAQSRSDQPAQRLSRPAMGNARREGGSAHPQAARKGSYFPTFLEPRRLAEKALAAVVQEAYVHGVVTPFARRCGQSDGHDRHLQKPSQPVVPRDR